MIAGRRAFRPARLATLAFRPPPPLSPGAAVAAAAAAAAAATAAVAGRGVQSGCSEGQEKPSRLDPWRARWSKGQTGWHLEDVNPALADFLGELLPGKPGHDGLGPRVLFPLCGKTADMPFLASQGFRVVGVEGVETPLQEFAAAHGATGLLVPVALPPDVNPESYRGHAVMIKSGDGQRMPSPILFVLGDFLAIGAPEAQALVPFDAAFDRGGLVAVAPGDRPRYAEVLSSLLQPGGRLLLVTVEHDAFADGRLGPPFEVTEQEVHALFDGSFEVRLLRREDRLPLDAGMRARGCARFSECAYLLRRRQAAAKAAAL